MTETPAGQHAPIVSRPTFVLTLDAELVWGSFDHLTPSEFERAYPDVRGTITSIIKLLETYEVSATWAVVGHLFLEQCTRSAEGLAHANLARPGQSWRAGDWYRADPCTDVRTDPLWYGPDILDKLQSAHVPQEIGSHSFAHVLFGDPELSREAVEADLRECVTLAAKRGIELRSFVFPRNSEGHHEALRAAGFKAFRGADPYRFAGTPRPVYRASHLATHALGLTPPVSRPSERLPGLWDIPGSTLFMHRAGLRRGISRRARVRRMRRGLEQAIVGGGVFHLWTHPFNVADDPRYLLGVLEDTLGLAVKARERGDLAIETMGSLAAKLSEST